MADTKAWVDALAGFFGVGVGTLAVQLYIDYRKQRAEAERQKFERRTRLRLFALEAVELQERWVQYSRQALVPEISRSTPFELTTPEQMNEIIKAGVDSDVLDAIYFMKEGNNDVGRMVRQAQSEHSRILSIPAADLVQISPPQRLAPQQTFNSATAFIVGRWERTSKAVAIIVAAANKCGADMKDLQARSKKNCEEYESLKPRLERAGQTEPPHKDGVPVPIK